MGYLSVDEEDNINPLNAELNPICHLLALLGAHHIFHVSGLRVKRDFSGMELEGMDWVNLVSFDKRGSKLRDVAGGG